MANRYAVIGQVFIVDGTATVAEAGRIATGGNTTLNITDPGGGGNFTIYMANGTSGTVTSGTSTVTGSPVTLSAGSNTITISGTGTATLNLTIGTAFNYSSVNSWSAASGGQCGASVPTSADNVYPDANSFTADSQTLTLGATSYCFDMDWTGATNNPTLAFGAQRLYAYGDVTFISAMTVTSTTSGQLMFRATVANSLTTGGLSLSQLPISVFTGATALNLQDDLTAYYLQPRTGTTLNTNNHALNLVYFTTYNYSGQTINLGSSTINISSVGNQGWTNSGTGITLGANTATINISGAGRFDNDNTLTGSYYIVNLLGSSHVVSGNNAYAELNLDPAVTQDVAFYDGTTQTVGDSNLSGSAGHIHTLRGSVTGGWTIAKSGGGTIEADYIDLSYSTGSPASTWYYGDNSTDSGNNSGWGFVCTPIKLALSIVGKIPVLKMNIVTGLLALVTSGKVSVLKLVITPATLALTAAGKIPVIGYKIVTGLATLVITLKNAVTGYGYVPTTKELTTTGKAPVLGYRIIAGLASLATTLKNAVTGYGYVPITKALTLILNNAVVFKIGHKSIGLSLPRRSISLKIPNRNL